MKHILKRKLLTIPLIVWGLQLLYVAVALGLFVVLFSSLKRQAPHLTVQILYVLGMLAINIAWRVAIRKMKPEWF